MNRGVQRFRAIETHAVVISFCASITWVKNILVPCENKLAKALSCLMSILSMEQQNISQEIQPALLTKTEIGWLLGKIRISKPYEYRLKSGLKRKLRTFTELELPLLIKSRYLHQEFDLTTDCKNLTANCKINYERQVSKSEHEKEWMGRDSNSRPPVCKTGILTRLDYPSDKTARQLRVLIVLECAKNQ